MNKPTPDWLVLIRSLVAGFDSTRDNQPNDHYRIQGLPIPLVIFVKEGEEWTDFVKPGFVGYLCATANVLFLPGLFTWTWILARKLRIKPK